MIMSGPIVQDEMCILNTLGGDNCFTAQFMAVDVISANVWLRQFDLSNLGGILGIGYIDSKSNASYANDFWDYVGQPDKQFSINLKPSIYDWGWNPNAPNVTGLESYMYLGGIDPNIYGYLKNVTKNSLLLTASPNSYWSFDFGSYSFGSNVNTNRQIYFEPLPLQFRLGFNGFGVPLVSYLEVADLLRVLLLDGNLVADLNCS